MDLLLKNLKDCGYSSEFLEILEKSPNYNIKNYVDELTDMNKLDEIQSNVKCENSILEY